MQSQQCGEPSASVAESVAHCWQPGASGPPANCELAEESPLFDLKQPAGGGEGGMRMLRLDSFAAIAQIGGILAAMSWYGGGADADAVLVRSKYACVRAASLGGGGRGRRGGGWGDLRWRGRASVVLR